MENYPYANLPIHLGTLINLYNDVIFLKYNSFRFYVIKINLFYPIESISYNYFSNTYGRGVTLSINNTVVTAISRNYAIAVTALPIPSGEPLQLRVVKPGFIVSAI